ncbi:hypothetical protein R70331_18875 [Paenibacillus sp. FSL R7-0331]|nr:hypothetical protein R70331_18875 [Paenibacillus sp. FSL R7-0331]
MSKKTYKLIANIITFCSIGYVIYIGFFVFFDKPGASDEIAALYLKMGYAYAILAVSLITRAILKKNKIL